MTGIRSKMSGEASLGGRNVNGIATRDMCLWRDPHDRRG